MKKEELEKLEGIKAKLIGLNAFLEGHTELNIKDILEEIEELTANADKENK